MFYRVAYLALSLMLFIQILGLHIHAYAANNEYSATLQGPLGLNTVPSARMREAGTITAGISTLDPYMHGYIGFQLAAPLYINIRQTAEVSHIDKNPDRLYPGIDLKLRLIKERQIIPEVALGFQSLIGHKRMAGEYLVASKRYKDLDFTLGLGWGRFGSTANIKNPLSALSSHFDKKRDLDGEMPNHSSDLFTGENIGVFGGLEYFTPYEGLSLKLDWGADRFTAEKTALNFNAPAPWGASLAYKPAPWIDMGIGMQGRDKLFARLSLQGKPSSWPFKSYKTEKPAPLRYYRTTQGHPAKMALSANAKGILLYDISAQENTSHAGLDLAPFISTPIQIGRAARHMANHGGLDTEELLITPTIYNLRGPTVKLMRRDLEQALAKGQGSPEEIWQGADFINNNKSTDNAAPHTPKLMEHLKADRYALTLQNDLSLSEEDHGALYRTSLLINTTGPKFFGLLTSGSSLRLNIKDNLYHLQDFRGVSPLPVRSNINEFAKNTFGLERAYTSYMHTIRPDLHTAISFGYLEEMYTGLGGEILYRPFKSRFALGAESWLAFKRDPKTSLNLGLSGDRVLTGHVKAWYDIPKHDLTLQGRAGRYLNEDIGATISLLKDFKNGAKLESYITISDQAEADLFGGTTHADHGLRLSLPLGSIKHVPQGSKTELNISPMGRDIGQILDNPMKLYEITKGFSYQHMVNNWDGVVK